jgi:hypothetical protein
MGKGVKAPPLLMTKPLGVYQASHMDQAPVLHFVVKVNCRAKVKFILIDE